ncbi:YaaC family protein [Kitasatospora sp. NPDC058048]|uniref:YaaC family protein n=1 Tax=Kitasatospora sp. NPDC058048 TaxID=3346313 RepID=UPI0036DBC8A6
MWQRIRGLRHSPPGPAGSDAERKLTFGAALEQSEQLFKSAETVDYSARPLLLFYGLSQAGRAIAAASTRASTPDEWQLNGHGIAVEKLDEQRLLSQCTVKNQNGKKGSFKQLAGLLGSASLPGDGALFGQLWSMVPELTRYPLTEQGAVHPVLRFGDTAMAAPGRAGWVKGIPAGEQGPGLEDFLSHYPGLHGTEPAGPPNDFSRGENDGTFTATRQWQLFPPATTTYLADDDTYLFPAVAGQSEVLHPLLLWWSLLFTLSMFARYHPSSWVAFLNIDQHQDSTALEVALDQALSICPQLIYSTIHAVSI